MWCKTSHQEAGLDWWFAFYAGLWVVSSVIVGAGLGLYFRRRARTEGGAPSGRGEQDRQATLKTLAEVLNSVERLTSEVGSHDTEIREVGRHVGELKVTGELESMQQAIMGHIGSVLESNQKLADELVVAHYQMETQAQELDRTRREARIDTLSGVGNRKAFDETVQWLVTTFKRDREPFCLILADIDRFKWVNDTHGHLVGDQVLVQMGSLLKLCVRGGDIVTRYGGDEFALLLPRTELAAGNQVAARLRLQIWRSSFHMGERGEQSVISLSVGVAAVKEGDTAESLIARADRALYRAKETGRNRVYCLPADQPEPQLVELAGQA
jgi:diguanylate cyclase